MKIEVISHLPATKGRALVQYAIDGIAHVGVHGDEPYALRFTNTSSSRVEVRLSVDGTDVLTGQPATTTSEGQRFVVPAYDSAELAAWPENRRGGARFLFTSADKSVAEHTHGVTSDVGVLAAAVFIEGYVAPPPRAYLKCGGGGASFSLGMRSAAGTGAGEYVEQHIGSTVGLREPKFSEIVRVRYLWWDDLVMLLRDRGVAPIGAGASGSPGFPGDRFKGIDLGTTPRAREAEDGPAAFAVIDDVNQCKDLIKQANEMIEKLNAVLSSPNRVRAFPEPSAARVVAPTSGEYHRVV